MNRDKTKRQIENLQIHVEVAGLLEELRKGLQYACASLEGPGPVDVIKERAKKAARILEIVDQLLEERR